MRDTPMLTDIMIYGRGRDRLEGYRSFAAPEYFTDEMLSAMMSFFGMHDEGDLSDAYPELFGSRDPWGRTYIFIAMPAPYCCALLRTTRVHDGDGWMTEVRGKEIWSLEGLCAPFEDKELFFAMAPSLILWLESDPRSLYERHLSGDISDSIDIPDKYIIDPYRDVPYDIAYEVMGDSFDAWSQLMREIRTCNGVRHFLFGPMAEIFAPSLRSDYNITAVYGRDTDPMPVHDPFEDIHMICASDRSGKVRRRELRMAVNDIDGADPEYRWLLADTASQADPLTTGWEPIPASGIDVYSMLAEADTAKAFADKLGWTEDAPYSFIEEV